MEGILQVATYGAIVVFVVAVWVRFRRIQRYPLHVRWELYPVPHEGARAEHGGSRLEETDWWTREHKPDRANQLKHMLQEMIFIKALRENNPRLWRFSFPFHFGLYLTAAFAALVVLLAVLGLAGVTTSGAGTIVAGFGAASLALTLLGALGLLSMRLFDDDLRPYTTFAHVFNLFFIAAALILVLAGLYRSGWDAAPYVDYATSLLTADMAAAPRDPTVAASIAVASVLLAYIPLTHMSHFFVKWFTWDRIRWDDEPNVKGGRIEKLIEQSLTFPVSWSADHIRGDGKKSWADVATEELKSE